MKTTTQDRKLRPPSRAFLLLERRVLSLAMTMVAMVIERRLIRSIKRAA